MTSGVRAKNAEGDSDWSETVEELPTAPVQFVEPDAPFIPPGLGVGDIFRLLFVSQFPIEATCGHPR